MSKFRNAVLTIVLLFVLAACDFFSPQPSPSFTPNATPQSTLSPQASTPAPNATGVPNATGAPSTFKPGNLFPTGLTNEPLAVMSTSPADETDEAAVTKDKARIVVQFNHPVVPLVSVSAQASLPQPLTLAPAVQGKGEWVNTATYVFTPAQDLNVATAYSVNVKPLTDMLGQSLNGFAFSFKTASPAISLRNPDDNTQFAGVTQPISVTFNTLMDHLSVESRFALKHLVSPTTNEFGPQMSGTFSWQSATLLFTPDKPLEFNATYVVQLSAGAQDVNKIAATKNNNNWTFRTVAKPDVASSVPSNGAQDSKDIRQGLLIHFTSPMDKESVKISIAPTLTNQFIFWQSSDKQGGDPSAGSGQALSARISGGWQASTPYVVTVSGESRGRYGDRVGHDVVIKFTTAPLDPTVTLNVPGMMGMYDVNGAQLMYATYVNMDKINYSLSRVERDDFLKLIGRDSFQLWQNYKPPAANKLRDWTQAVSTSLNAARLVSTTLTTGAPLAAGVYYLEANASANAAGKTWDKHLLVVTGVNLALKRTSSEALVWATDLKTGKPVANLPLTLFGSASTAIESGQTDADGVYRTALNNVRVFDAVFAISEQAGRVVAAVGSDWSNGIAPFDFSLPVQYEPQKYYANIYTDRPIYRPGQTVYFKGILRRDNDVDYSLPSDVSALPIRVNDSQGREVYSQAVPLDKFGTFNGEVKLSEVARTGYYNLSLQLGDAKSGNQQLYSSVSFVVAEYRKPEFDVNVKSDKTEYIAGETIKVDALTTYFFGGAVSDANVTWRLLSDDFFFQPANVKGYWDFTDTDLLQNRKQVGGVIRDGKSKTDSAGNFHIEVPADLRDYPLSQNFTIEVEVTDINNQSVANRITLPVHKGQFYIGLKPQRYVGTMGVAQSFDVLSVDPQGKAVGNKPLTVSFYERQWFSVREKREDGNFYWTSHYSDTLAAKQDVTTNADGVTLAQFTPSKGGVYRIVAEGKDANGNSIRSATYQWVASSGFVNWRQDNNDRLELVSDKKQYAVGETAEILIPAPFAGAEALLTIERGSIREVKRMTLQGNSEKVSVPIRADYAPNIFVSVMLVKGRGGATVPAQFKLGYVALEVNTAQKELNLKLTSDKQKVGPGDKVTYIVEAMDASGKPVVAELSVALVDKAVQSLANDTSQSALQAFYGRRGLAVQTATTLVRSVERLNETVQANSKGGGGGGAQAALPAVRRNFLDTAYWNANVTTDASGKAQVSVTLPDNLTTWNLTAKGVTMSTLVGEARTDVIATKDLLVRPVTPRFFVVGDQAQIEAVVNNNTDEALMVEVNLETNAFDAKGPLQATTVKAHDKGKVQWFGIIKPVDEVTLRFTATSLNGSRPQDSIEYKIPVKRAESAETVATAGQVEIKIAEQIKLPANADKSAGALQIELSPSLAAASRSSLKYLESFPYACAECVVSSFFPNIATYAELKKLGIERDDLRKQLEANIAHDIPRLYALQNGDGGWGWWQNDQSRPMLTAYALLGLNLASKSGFAVDQLVMNRAEQSLIRTFEKPVDAKFGYEYNERAFVIFTLTEMGRNYTSRAVNLFEQRANPSAGSGQGLANYGKAYLLMAMATLKLPQAQTLQSELTSAAMQSAAGVHWEEAKPDYWMMNTNTRSTAIVIMALARSDPKNATLANATRWLMAARKAGHWETTQETAWAVLALTEYMQETGELNGNYTYQVLVNGKLVEGDVKVDKSNIDQPHVVSVPLKDLVQDAANELLISRGAGDGKLYYSANLQYFLPAENIPALNKGILVGRQYYAVDQATLKPTVTTDAIASAKIGDYVLVKLVVVAPSDMNYLVLEDPLPAGFEAVDTTLKTASIAAQKGGLKQQQPQPASGDDRYFQPYWTYWAHSEVRDDRVSVFATYLGRGTYEYTYMMRASVAGEFRTLPARAWQMYFPDVQGRSEGAKFQVLP